MIKWRALASPRYDRDEANIWLWPALALVESISSFVYP